MSVPQPSDNVPSRGHAIYLECIIAPIVSGIFVLLRAYARFFLTKKNHASDCKAVPAAPLSNLWPCAGHAATVYLSKRARCSAASLAPEPIAKAVDGMLIKGCRGVLRNVDMGCLLLHHACACDMAWHGETHMGQ